MKAMLVDGVFTLNGCYMIKDSRDDFIRRASVDRMMQHQFVSAVAADEEDLQRRMSLVESMFKLDIAKFDKQPFECEVISKDYFKNSAPGFIYLVGSIEELRACSVDTRILLLLKDPAQDMYLDITISPYNFGYGLEFPDVGLQVSQPMVSYNASYMAWLAVEPGVCNPLKIEPVEYVNRNYLHHAVYQ